MYIDRHAEEDQVQAILSIMSGKAGGFPALWASMFPEGRKVLGVERADINYEIAPDTMLEALDKLEKGDDNFLPNDDADATYNSIPTLRDAFRFRFGLSWDGNAQASAP